MTASNNDFILNVIVASNILNKRKKLGYSGKVMADFLGISQQQFSRYERGKSMINVEMLFKISVILQEPIDYFFKFDKH